MHLVQVEADEGDVIHLSPALRERWRLTANTVILHFGACQHKLTIHSNDAWSADTIGLPKSRFTDAARMNTCNYKVMMRDGHLYLGPVIAILISSSSLAMRERNDWKDYFCEFPDRDGMLYLCTVEDLDYPNRQANGYYYDVEQQAWRSGRFPYPSVIYRRARLRLPLLKKLNRQRDVRVFNAYCFHKKEMWQTLSRAGYGHIPHTGRLQELKDLVGMMRQHSAVYLKPELGSMGQGIQKVTRIGDKYLFQDRDGRRVEVATLTKVYQLFRKYKKKGDYLVQQAIAAQLKQQQVDFRVILQKDAREIWTCTGAIARYGQEGQICTNQVSELTTALESLQHVYGIDKERAAEKEQEIIALCKKACIRLERAFGTYGDVGIDVILDHKQHVWLLEVNNLHQHEIAKYVDQDPEMYAQVIRKPLQYAASLAGFK